MSVNIYGLVKRRAIVTREAARAIAAAIGDMALPGDQALVLDFEGVEAVSPSFVDELLASLADLEPQGPRTVRFRRPPTRLSAKFEAIGRARQMDISEGDGEWVITLPIEATTSDT